jgi:hypothetical protein
LQPAGQTTGEIRIHKELALHIPEVELREKRVGSEEKGTSEMHAIHAAISSISTGRQWNIT